MSADRLHETTEIDVIRPEERDVAAWIDANKALEEAIKTRGALNAMLIQWDEFFEQIRSLSSKVANLKGRLNTLRDRVDMLEEEADGPIIKDPPRRRERGKSLRVT